MLSNFRYVHAENKKTRYKPCILVFSRPIEKGKRLSQNLETQTFHYEHPKLPIRSVDRLSFLRMTQEVQALGLLVSVS